MATRVAEIGKGVPALSEERQVTWPKRTRTRLPNGLEVVLAEDRRGPFLERGSGHERDFLCRFVRVCGAAAGPGE